MPTTIRNILQARWERSNAQSETATTVNASVSTLPIDNGQAGTEDPLQLSWSSAEISSDDERPIPRPFEGLPSAWRSVGTASSSTRLQQLQSALSSRTTPRAETIRDRRQSFVVSDSGDESEALRDVGPPSSFRPTPRNMFDRDLPAFDPPTPGWTSPIPVDRALNVIRSGLSFLSDSTAASPAVSHATLDMPRTQPEVESARTERSFDEASDRVLDLGLDILRRANDPVMITTHHSDFETDAGLGSMASSDDEIDFGCPVRKSFEPSGSIAERRRRAPSVNAWGTGSRRPLPPRPAVVPRLSPWRRHNSTVRPSIIITGVNVFCFILGLPASRQS